MANNDNTREPHNSICNTFWHVNESTGSAVNYLTISGKMLNGRTADKIVTNISYKQISHPATVPIVQKKNGYTEGTITDTSVKRVLTPVIWMIHKGRFDSLTTH